MLLTWHPSVDSVCMRCNPSNPNMESSSRSRITRRHLVLADRLASISESSRARRRHYCLLNYHRHCWHLLWIRSVPRRLLRVELHELHRVLVEVPSYNCNKSCAALRRQDSREDAEAAKLSKGQRSVRNGHSLGFLIYIG